MLSLATLERILLAVCSVLEVLMKALDKHVDSVPAP